MNNVEQARKRAARGRLLALCYLLLVGILLALSVVVAKQADIAGLPRLTFLVLAMGGAAIVLLGVTVCQRQLMPLNRRTLEYALVSGALFALPNALAFLAVGHVGAGFVSLSYAFPILITWMLAVFLRLERPQILRFVGVMLALAGGLLLTSSKIGGADGTGVWVGMVLGIPAILALGNIYRTMRWPAAAAPIFLAALMMTGGAVTLLPFALLFERGEAVGLIGLAGFSLLFLEIVIFAVLYVFYFLLQKLAGPVYLSQIGTVAAVAGTLIALFFLSEPMPTNLMVAGALVALGTLLFHCSVEAAAVKPFIDHQG